MDKLERAQIGRLGPLADHVREKSRAGELVRLDGIGGGPCEEADDPAGSPDPESVRDLQIVREGSAVFLFSDRHMTRAYAEAAARAATGDRPGMIAAAVRFDSATYPRPTPVEAFLGRPYLLTGAEIDAVIRQIGEIADLADIRVIRASNGNRFLYSADHISEAQAQAIAERIAVAQFENP